MRRCSRSTSRVQTADGFFDRVREHGVQVFTTSGRAEDERRSTEYRTLTTILLRRAARRPVVAGLVQPLCSTCDWLRALLAGG